MMYFDSAYIFKCYVNEMDSAPVRELARTARGLYSCEWAKVEFSCALHRRMREKYLRPTDARKVFELFLKDETNSTWNWLPVTSDLLTETRDQVRVLARTCFIRAGDALHLACAKENGFTEIYSNDRHLLAAAKHFGLKGVNIVK